MATRARPGRPVPSAAELRAVGRAAGLDAVGVAPAAPFATTRRHLERRRAAGLHGGMAFTYRRPERSTAPGAALREARALVVGARSYRRPVPEPAEGTGAGPPRGRVARYAWSDHYGALRQALTAVAGRLRADGWRARVLADDNALVDREAAYRAGLGWYGKNANLLLPGEGSWFVLGSVVTDAPVEVTPPDERVADGCGSCTRCLGACPTGAIVAPGVVDARRCLAWLLQVEGRFPPEHRVALGDRIYGCDDCQEVCPPNRRLDRRRPAAVAGGPPNGTDVPTPGRADVPGHGRADVAAPAGADAPAHGGAAVPVPGGVGGVDVAAPGRDGAPAISGREPAEAVVSEPPTGEPVVDLLDMLAATDDELLARHGRWYVPRRQPRYLRRNALVVLGNVARPRDPAVVATLRRALGADDPLVRGHAVWAARRLGRDDLLTAVAGDADPLVRVELSERVAVRAATGGGQA